MKNINISITCIVVLYKCDLNDSPTIRGLISNYNNNPKLFEHFRLIIYENGQRDSKDIIFPFNAEHIRKDNNEGVAKAYNYALKAAIEDNCEWLLLLDQDTKIPNNFISKLIDRISSANSQEVVAIVPKIYYNESQISPSEVRWGGVHRPIEDNNLDTSELEINALGSGSSISVAYLMGIGGFNNEYWLDGLDRWLFRKIYLSGNKVILVDVELQHGLSIMDFKNNVSLDRYENMLKYEILFMSEYRTSLEMVYMIVRLFRRAFIVFYKTKHIEYFMCTFSFIKKILISLISNKQHKT